MELAATWWLSVKLKDLTISSSYMCHMAAYAPTPAPRSPSWRHTAGTDDIDGRIRCAACSLTDGADVSVLSSSRILDSNSAMFSSSI